MTVACQYVNNMCATVKTLVILLLCGVVMGAGPVKSMAQDTVADKLSQAGIPVLLMDVRFSVDTAGGVEPRFDVHNYSAKSIKYVTLSLVGYNSVGDVAPARITGRTTQNLRGAGPVEPGKNAWWDYTDSPAWYTTNTRCLEVRKMTIQYFDGSTYVAVNDLPKMRDIADSTFNIRGECKAK